MSSDKNLNICNSSFVINNDQYITMPAAGQINSYDINFVKPCFFINNHYLTPLLKSYNVILQNPISLENNDKFIIKIKVPKNVIGKKYGYDLQNLYDNIDSLNLKVSMRLKSSDGYYNINSGNNNEQGFLNINLSDHCGWLVFNILYGVNQEKICNLCEISYSLSFDPINIKLLYGKYNNNNNEKNVEVPIDTCLLLCKASIGI